MSRHDIFCSVFVLGGNAQKLSTSKSWSIAVIPTVKTVLQPKKSLLNTDLKVVNSYDFNYLMFTNKSSSALPLFSTQLLSSKCYVKRTCQFHSPDLYEVVASQLRLK